MAAQSLARPAVRALLVLAAAYLLWLRRNLRRIRLLMALPPYRRSLLGDLGSVVKLPFYRLASGPAVPHVFPVVSRLAASGRSEGIRTVDILHPLVPGSIQALLVCDIDIVKQVLHQRSAGRYIKGESYRTAEPLVGHGLLSAPDSAAWRVMRDATNAGLKLPSLERALQVSARVAEDMVGKWRTLEYSDRGIDVYDWAVRLTMDVLGQVAFSYDFKSVASTNPEDAPLFTAFQTILSVLAHRVALNIPAWCNVLPTRRNRDFNAAITKLNGLCKDLVRQRQGALAQRTPSRAARPVAVDVLESLLVKDEGGKQLLTDQQVRDTMRTILFAGHDTTASALSWALHLLATHPDWQKQVREELGRAGFKATCVEAGTAPGKSLPEDLSLRGLEELKVLTAVVRETLRLYPSAGFTREALEPMKVKARSGKEFVVPAGVEMFFFPNAVQQDPALHDDPMAFCPDRWMGAAGEVSPGADGARRSFPAGADASPTAASPTASPTSGLQGPRSAYFPFSLGARNCVGERLALTEIRVALALLLTNFEFRVPPGCAAPEQLLLMSLQPHGVRLQIKPL